MRGNLARILLYHEQINFLEERTMKRIITIMVVTALVAGVAFGRGNSEESNGNRQGTGMRYSGETITLIGTVEDVDGQVVLNSGGEVYSLSAPGFYRDGIELPFGETIEVRGMITDSLEEGCDIDADGHIFVETAAAGGEEYTFQTGRSAGNSRRGGGSRGNGTQGGRRWSTTS
jgi:hypothetical protein